MGRGTRASTGDEPRTRSSWAQAGSATVLLGAVLSVLAMLATAAGAGPANPPSGGGGPANPPPGYTVHHGPNNTTDENVCSYDVAPGTARCLARVRTDPQARSESPARAGTVSPTRVGGTSATIGNNGAYDPSWLESAYNDPWYVNSSTKSTAGTGQTVAIVDAYDDPNAQSDLSSYRSYFGLPACTSGCFRKVNETGGTSYPAGNTGWATEESLDLDMVSAICANCNILLVEASSASIADLGTAVNEAIKLGANVVSNSYGSSEYSSEVTDSTSYYNHPGVPVVASSGDSGYGVEFPAASPTVTAVGGTSLNQATNTGTRNATETVWSGAGSGCSAYEAKPSWQTDTGCTRRTVADTSAVANPSTGVWVYDTYGGGTWSIYGGTSVASPIVSSFYALAGNAGGATVPASELYSHIADLNQVKSGSNGSCGSYLCNAADSLLNGYNGPTGLGTPNGVTAFSSGPSAPGAPSGVSATGGNAQATVSFTAPADNGSPITTYTVTAADSTNPAHGGQTATGSGSPITVTGLTNGDSYTFTVTATNGVGTGPASSPSNAVTPYTVPGAPTGVTASAGNTDASVSFTAPANNGGSTITSYTVTATDTTTTSNGGQTVSGSASPITVNGLTNGDSYTFSVTATNAAGTGPPSTSSSPVTPEPGKPSAPTGVSASAGNAQATVSFTPPANDGGSAITSYTVTAADSTTPSNGGQTASGAGSPITVTGLTNGDSYTFSVTATNIEGTGPASAPSNAVTPYTVPDAPGSVTASAGAGAATVDFSAPPDNGSPISSYAVTATDSTYSGRGGQKVSGSASPITVTGLTAGDTYTFTVTATNAAGTGPASSPSNPVVPTSAATVPGAPGSLTAKTDASRGVDLAWNAPASNGGAQVTSYTVYRSTRSGRETAYTTVNCSSSSCTFHDTSTSRFSTYYYKVAATNIVGTGPESNEASARAR